MDLANALWTALSSIFSLQGCFYMMLGTLIGLTIGIIPGIGGNFCLAMMIPFIITMREQIPAIIFLESAHAVVATGGAVTAILINTPGSSMNAVTALDGYPMTQKGQAGRALGAASCSSGVGGVFGAILLFASIPILRPLIMLLSQPEFFALCVFGLVLIAFVGTGDFMKSIVSGVIGILISFVGDDPGLGFPRLIFGMPALRPGLPLVPVVIGLFAFSSMMDLIITNTSIAQKMDKAKGGVWTGIVDVFEHWWLTLRCSALGTFIGFVPGLGGEVAAFLAYGYAAQVTKHKGTFGTGEVEGVIGPEAANNSKEGGALIPTIAFGVPGSSGMAIMLMAFIALGVDVGPNMLTDDLPFTMTMILTLAISNIIGAALICLFANQLARIALLPSYTVVPLVFICASLGAHVSTFSTFGLTVAVIATIFGFYFRRYGFSISTLVIGRVLGILIEKNYDLSVRLFGPGFIFVRPITIVLFVLCLATVIWGLIKERKRAQEAKAAEKAPVSFGDVLYSCLIAVMCVIVLVEATGVDPRVRTLPLACAVCAIIGIIYVLLRDLRQMPKGAHKGFAIDFTHIKAFGWVVGLWVSIVMVGFPVTAVIYPTIYMRVRKAPWKQVGIMAVILLFITYFLFMRVLDIMLNNGIIGNLIGIRYFF